MRGSATLLAATLSWDGTAEPSSPQREPAWRPFPRRRGFRYALAALVVAVAALVAGPFVFFHLVEGPAPPSLALPRASAGTGGPSSPLDGTWRVGKGSRAEYRVHEFLFGQSGVAVGSTPDVSGTVVVDGATVTHAAITVDMRTVTTNMAGRNVMFHDAIMKTATYPYGVFKLARPIHLGKLPAAGQVVNVRALGD